MDLQSATEQGAEYTNVILSIGRQGQGDGFLKDRRRLNVGISRARRVMIVLLEKSVGRSDGLISHFRQVFIDLNVECVLPSGAIGNPEVAAKHVISALQSSPVLSDDTVRKCIRQHGEFFDAYQKEVVGSVGSLSAYPESESETEAVPDEKEDVVDVCQEISASRQREDYTVADVEDEDTTAGIVQRPISVEQYLHDGAGWDRFGLIWMGNPIKFHNSAMYHFHQDRDYLGFLPVFL